MARNPKDIRSLDQDPIPIENDVKEKISSPED